MIILCLMEEPLVEPRSRIFELLKRALNVPTHDPTFHEAQPRRTRGITQAMKIFPITSSRQIVSEDTTADAEVAPTTIQNVVSLDTPRPSSTTLNNSTAPTHAVPPERVHKLTRITPSVLPSISVRVAKTKTTFSKHLLWDRWKRSAPDHADIHVGVSSLPRQDRDQTQCLEPTIIRSESPHVLSVNTTSEQTETNSSRTIVQGQGIQSPTDANNSVDHPDCNSAPSAHVQNGEIVSNPNSKRDSAVEVPVGSKKLFRPEAGMAVAKLDQISPPSELEAEWRRIIRPELRNNLQQVLSALPKNLSRAQTAIEIEFCMSGKVSPGAQNVSLNATIWIRCGSDTCEQSVRSAVSKLKIVQGRHVHVTRCAPRPANQAPQALQFFDGGWLLPIEYSDLDDIVPAGNSSIGTMGRNDDWKQAIGDGNICIRVQSPLHSSVCGHWVHFLTSDGSTYKSTIGGMILVDNKIYALTTGHALWDPNFASQSNSSSPSNNGHSIYGPYYESCQGRLNYEATFPRGLPAETSRLFRRAALVGANYGTASDSSEQGEIQNQDFALLHVDFEEGQQIENRYRTSSGQQTVDTISNDLTSRDVHIVCSSGNASWGRLLDGTSTIIDNRGVWETRKIRLNTQLSCGASGSWVVDGRTLLGIITAVYDEEPFAHMIPIQSIFSGIQSILTKNGQKPSVNVNDRTWTMPHKVAVPGLTQKVERVRLRPNRPTVIDPVLSLHNSTPSKADPAGIYPRDRTPHPTHNARPRKATLLEVFVPTCFMIFTLSWDIAAFPVVMPSITDNSKSLGYAGWFGFTYFLSFGVMSTEAHKIIAAVVNQWPRQGLSCFLAANIVIFGAGLISSCISNSVPSIIVGRALCGLGASAMLTSVHLLHELLEKPQRCKNGALLLGVHAVVRFVAPISAAAFSKNDKAHSGYRDNFFFAIALTGVTLVVTCTFISGRSLKCCKVVVLRTESHATTVIALVTMGLKMCSLAGAYVGLTIGSYLVSFPSYKKGRVVQTLTVVSFVSAFICLVIQAAFRNPRIRMPKEASQRSHVGLLMEWGIKFLWGSAFYPFTHFYPLWLRTVQEQSILYTGTKYLPLASSFLLVFVLAATMHDYISPKTRFRGIKIQYTSPVISLAAMSLASGLSARYRSHSSSNTYVAFALLFGWGAAWNMLGYGRLIAPWSFRNKRFTEDDHETSFSKISRSAYLTAAEALGGCLGIAMAQVAFSAQLSRAKVGLYHDLFKFPVFDGGATSYTAHITPDAVEDVKKAFNKALTNSFFVATTAGALTFVIFIVAVVLYRFPFFRRLLERWEKRQKPERELANDLNLRDIPLESLSGSQTEIDPLDVDSLDSTSSIHARNRWHWMWLSLLKYFRSRPERGTPSLELQSVSRRPRRSSRGSFDSNGHIQDAAAARRIQARGWGSNESL